MGLNLLLRAATFSHFKLLINRCLLLVVAALVLASCGGETVTLRYKMIAVAWIGDKRYEAYAVNEMDFYFTPGSLSGNTMGVSLSAEATILDLGDRGAIYILQNRGDHAHMILDAFDIAKSPGSMNDEKFNKLKLVQQMGREPYPEDYVMLKMVAFRDEKDKSTIYEVTRENFKKLFGKDARFEDLYIEPTNEPLSDKIKKRLPWYKYSGGALVRKKRGAPMVLMVDSPIGRRTSHNVFKQ